MAITFVGSAENSAANGGDVTLTFPGGVQQGDLVIVAYAVGDNDNIDENMAMITTGYTEVADLFANDTQDCDLGVYWKIMGVTPDTTAQVDGLGGSDAAVAAVCMIFRGVNPATPMDVTPTTATNINTMHPDPPSIDHNNPSGVWTVIAGAAGHTLAGAGTFTFPTGYTTNAIDRGSDDTGGDCTVGMGYREAPADPENPGVMTHSGTDSANFAWCACTIALRPAAVLNAEAGSYSITGAAATLELNRLFNAEPGSYVITGFDATLTQAAAGANLNAEPGAYSITGQAATLEVNRIFNAESGSYSVTGSAATILLGAVMDAVAGVYSYVGAAAELIVNEIIAAYKGGGMGQVAVTLASKLFRRRGRPGMRN